MIVYFVDVLVLLSHEKLWPYDFALDFELFTGSKNHCQPFFSQKSIASFSLLNCKLMLDNGSPLQQTLMFYVYRVISSKVTSIYLGNTRKYEKNVPGILFGLRDNLENMWATLKTPLTQKCLIHIYRLCYFKLESIKNNEFGWKKDARTCRLRTRIKWYNNSC